MDTDHLKTFLEVNRTRHFGQAANNLFLSQSAVTARIQSLENQLGTPLFIRARNAIELTPAGHRLLRHAENILAAWNRAKQDLIVDAETTASLAIAGMPSLWDLLLQDWLHTVHRQHPTIAIHADIGDANTLLRGLLEGTLDLGFTFDAPQIPKITARHIGTIPLIKVSTHDANTAPDHMNDIHVDWGLSFAIAYAQQFPESGIPKVRLPLGRIALEYLLTFGGTAYLAESSVVPAIQAGQLFPVADAPVLTRHAYALYAKESDHISLINEVLDYFDISARHKALTK